MSIKRIICIFIACAVAGAAQVQAEEEMNLQRALGSEYPSYHTSVADSQMVPSGDLRLRDALALALLHNPDLAVFSLEIRAAEAARLQAGAWPNPEVGFEYENFGGGGIFSGGQAAEATLTLSQLVPLGGKLGKRTDVARLDHRLSGWDYEIARVRTYAATVTAVVNLLEAQEQLSLTEKLVEIAEGIHEAVSARVQAGGALVLEENRARVAVETSKIESVLAQRRLAMARKNLSALWGSDNPQFRRAVGGLDLTAVDIPALEDLLERVNQNPEIERWVTEMQRREARGRHVRAMRVPDLTLGAGVRHHSFDDEFAFLLGISAPVPLWDRKQSAVRETDLLTEQAGYQRAALAVDIRRNIGVTYETMASAFDEAGRLRDRVLPEAEAAAESSEEAYLAGAIQLTDVLDIQRTFFRLRARYVNALARYHRSVSNLEALVGESVGSDLRGEGDSEMETGQ